jgi:hypothetical protein
VSVDGRVEETTTKIRSGRRQVPLSDAAVAALLSCSSTKTESVKRLRRLGGATGTSSRWRTAGA